MTGGTKIPGEQWFSVDLNSSMIVPEFKSKGWFNIPGRGWVAVVDLPEPINRDKLMEAYRHVKIDGKEYEITAFEGWALQVLKNDVGLLVKGGPPDRDGR